MIEKNKDSDLMGDKEILDDLIAKSYKEIRNDPDKFNKLGDLIKMMEQRRKMSPTDTEQKKFWQMINKIRHETLSPAKVKTSKASKSKKKR